MRLGCWCDLEVADDQFHLAFEVDGGDSAGGQQVASLWTGSPQTVPLPSMTDRHMKGQRCSGLAAVDAHAINGVAGVGLELGHAVDFGCGHGTVDRGLTSKSMQSRLCSMCSGRSLPSVPGRS